jgi:hypothetical protein
MAATRPWNRASRPDDKRIDPAYHLRGEQRPMAQLTDEAVRMIRELYSLGIPKRALARLFGVDRRTIDFVVRRATWRHVE